jgi:hypothetical protein
MSLRQSDFASYHGSKCSTPFPPKKIAAEVGRRFSPDHSGLDPLVEAASNPRVPVVTSAEVWNLLVLLFVVCPMILFAFMQGAQKKNGKACC